MSPACSAAPSALLPRAFNASGHRTMTRYSLQVLREGVNCQLEACLQIAEIRESVAVSGIEGGSGRGLVEKGLRVKGVFV